MPKRLSRKEIEYMMDFEGDPFIDGYRRGYAEAMKILERTQTGSREGPAHFLALREMKRKRPKRKLSAWNKFVKANSNKPRFRYKSGAKKGKLNLRAMGVAFRKTPAGKKKRR